MPVAASPEPGEMRRATGLAALASGIPRPLGTQRGARASKLPRPVVRHAWDPAVLQEGSGEGGTRPPGAAKARGPEGTLAKKKGARGPQRAVKGFRPGKEPVQLKRQAAKAQLGKDAGWAQKQAVDAVAGRSRSEVRAMVQRWSLGLGVAGLVLAVVGLFLYGWLWPVAAAVHVLAAVLLFLAYRVRKQGSALEDMADALR